MDHALVESLAQVGQRLSEQAALDPAEPATPSLSFGQAVSITLARLSGQNLPEPAGKPAVELLGFLELAWDDAAHAVLCDVNEGNVPDSRNADAFLPDGLRRTLGLSDNARRYARDVLLLNIILNTRPRGDAVVLACRRSAEGDPLTPSRLLLACDPDTLVARIQDFYPEDETAGDGPSPLLLAAGGENRFLIPRPHQDHPPLTELGVTRFRDYLACPYRFYLKHVADLQPTDDRADELGAAAFGNLAHEVLANFGGSDVAASTDAQAIAAWLERELDRQVQKLYGSRPAAALRVQAENLRQRLNMFARAQAQEVQAGWRIDRGYIERKVAARIEVDGKPFTINGKIDRLDRHPERGVRLIDYKTRDKGADLVRELRPESVHRKKDGTWIDLQLPLYRVLAQQWGVDDAATGYFNLGRNPQTTRVDLADWSEADFASAMACRDGVIRDLRAGRFWPPLAPPAFDDGLSRLAADHDLNRAQLIEAST